MNTRDDVWYGCVVVLTCGVCVCVCLCAPARACVRIILRRHHDTSEVVTSDGGGLLRVPAEERVLDESPIGMYCKPTIYTEL